MTTVKNSSETLITNGCTTIFTRELNSLTDIKQIRECLHRLFSTSLPDSYRIVYYDQNTSMFADLEDQLQQGLSPFPVISSANIEDRTNVLHNIHLYITRDSITNPDILCQLKLGIDDNSLNSEIYIESHKNRGMNFSNKLVPYVHTDLSETKHVTQDSGALNLRKRTSKPNLKSISTVESSPSDRLFFSLDVKPIQKNIYRTDQFRVDPNRSHGQISRVQGIKEENQKMLRVLPRVRIPLKYQNADVTLSVYVVSEILENNVCVWYKHAHKGFLPVNYTEDSERVNPIEFSLNDCHFSPDGDFELNLPMITKWDKVSKGLLKVHELSNKEASRLHSATNDPYSPRLLCVLRQDDKTLWNTFCLSDFIRCRKPAKRAYSKLAADQLKSPSTKRPKTND
ncbi:unnamed protein product [Adineta ricciae]|uniref:Uncharacterized protein n=1 Tax=Adineta ricciae TaxID=249248 RepID=A0A813P0K9_ADIRI|nr:unnamed protein product [Adineta ricciae]CAF1322047.1 unnamed protein product [Adineta ricciae]